MKFAFNQNLLALLKMWYVKIDEITEIGLKQYLDSVGTQLLFATVGSLIKYIHQNTGNKILLWKDSLSA